MCHTYDSFHKASRQNASRRTWAGTQNGVKGPVVWQTSQFPPAPMSAQSVTRIAGSGTTVYQCCTYSQSLQDCASFVSSSRNSNRTATRSSLHARRPSVVDTSKTKTQIRVKGTTERAIHHTKEKTKPQITGKYPVRELSPLQFYIDSKY